MHEFQEKVNLMFNEQYKALNLPGSLMPNQVKEFIDIMIDFVSNQPGSSDLRSKCTADIFGPKKIEINFVQHVATALEKDKDSILYNMPAALTHSKSDIVSNFNFRNFTSIHLESFHSTTAPHFRSTKSATNKIFIIFSTNINIYTITSRCDTP